MKSVVVLGLLSIFLFSCSSVQDVSLENRRVVVLGDSITQAGHYVSYLEYYLQKNKPESDFDIISVGLASETVSGLSEKEHPFPRPCVHSRLKDVLKATKPEVLITCYGMNDGIYNPQSPERFKAYKDGYSQLFEIARDSGVKQIMVLTPPPFDPNPIKKKLIEAGNFSYKTPYAKYNNVLSDYSKYLLTLKDADIKVIDLHASLFFYTFFKSKDIQNLDNKDMQNFTLSKDGIHPGQEGHLLMAQTILRALKFDFEYTEPAKYSIINENPLFKLVAKKRSLRSKGWLEYIGYTRGKTVKKDSVEKVEESVLLLQREIDKLRKK